MDLAAWDQPFQATLPGEPSHVTRNVARVKQHAWVTNQASHITRQTSHKFP